MLVIELVYGDLGFYEDNKSDSLHLKVDTILRVAHRKVENMPEQGYWVSWPTEMVESL